MNKLEIRLKAHNDGTDEIDYLVVVIKIDCKPLTNFDYYATDMNQLQQSVNQDGEYFILTCWCGIAECAGVKQGVQVRNEKKVVCWQVKDPKPKQSFVFEHEEYEKAICDVIKQGNRLISYLKSASERQIEMTPAQNERFFDSVQRSRSPSRRSS